MIDLFLIMRKSGDEPDTSMKEMDAISSEAVNK